MKDALKLFALESSASAASVAVYQEGRLLGEQYMNTAETHSATLLPMAQRLMELVHLCAADFDYFAVSRGPGSFTGLRIGIAAIKGLAFPADTPCVGVSTLEALAYNLRGYEGTVAAVMDARCHQVYGALFEAYEGKIIRLTEDAALPIEELGRLLAERSGTSWLVGDGAVLCYEALHTELPRLFLAPEAMRFQRAGSVGAVALERLNEAVPPATLMPSYLRPVHAATLAERPQAENVQSLL